MKSGSDEDGKVQSMTHQYLELIHLVERLHRHCLDVLKVELDKLGIRDINNVQTLILYNIGEDDLTVGELTARGYYLGSNVSYNLKKMVEAGYLDQQRSIHDRRSVRIRLSEKGKDLRDKVSALFDKQIKDLGHAEIAMEEIGSANETLRRLEQFWTGRIGYGFSPSGMIS